MTEEDQKSAVGEALGYRWSMPDEAFFKNGSFAIKKLKDYPNSLDAMWSAEQQLTDTQHACFRIHLKSVVKARLHPLKSWEREVVSATASERCEAFLRALDKWKE